MTHRVPLTRSIELPIYIQTEVGGKSKEQLVAEIKANEMFVCGTAQDIMTSDGWKPGEREVVQFGWLRVSELGFTEPPTTAEVWARIRECGHSLCEPYDGPALRLFLKDQPKYGRFWIAMKILTDRYRDRRIFLIKRYEDGRRWLTTERLNLCYRWDLRSDVMVRIGQRSTAV